MRITEHRMVELASAGISSSRERVARAGDQLSSGERISRPSDDPAAWAAARRAEAARTVNQGRGMALGSVQDRLELVDNALDQIGSSMVRATELAVLAASETNDQVSLDVLAAEVHSLRQAVLAAANTRASDGEYILAGSLTDQQPFDADGVYHGDDAVRSIETHTGIQQPVTVSGAVLTAAAGVDIFAELDAFEAALRSNDRAGIERALGVIRTGHHQVSEARADGGGKSAALVAAQEDQAKLDVSLQALQGRLVGADPIAAATELAQHSNSLEAAQAVAQRIIELTRP
jgi:flagellar hook-associated protein 3 FlgL